MSVTDDNGGRGSATAGVQTLPADRAPVATNRTVATDQDVPADVTLDASDPDGNTLMYELVSSPSHGQVVLTPPGSFIPGLTPDLIYFPDPGYSGEDSFTFKASDGRLESNVASVSISVSSTNGAPDAQNDAATTDEGTPVVIDVLANDTDPDGDTLVVESVGDRRTARQS